MQTQEKPQDSLEEGDKSERKHQLLNPTDSIAWG